MSQSEVVLKRKSDCQYLYNCFIANSISETELYENLISINIIPTSAFKHTIRKKSHDILFSDMIRTLCRIDNTRDQQNNLKENNTFPCNFHVQTETSFEDPYHQQPPYLRAPFGTPDPSFSSLTANNITDLETGLRNVIHGHLDICEFEKVIDKLKIKLNPSQSKILSRLKYDRSVDLKSLWMAFSGTESRFYNYSVEDGLKSKRESIPQPAKSGNIFTWKGCTDKPKTRRKRKICIENDNTTNNIVKWNTQTENTNKFKTREINPKLKKHLSSHIQSNEGDMIGTDDPPDVGVKCGMGTRENKNHQEKNFEKSFKMEWPKQNSSNSDPVDSVENPVMWSKFCYDEREPIENEEFPPRIELKFETKKPITNPPFGTYRDQFNDCKGRKDYDLRVLENTLERMEFQNHIRHFT